MRSDHGYKYKKIDRNFKSNNTLTGTASNYEYDVFDNNNSPFKQKNNGLYDFLKKTQKLSTPKSQTSYQAAFGGTSSNKGAQLGGGDGSAYAFSRTVSHINSKQGKSN